MATRSGRLRNSKQPPVVQDSRLLNLPAELRNLIYEFVAQSTDAISFRGQCILYCPTLSLVCRQVRDEYEPIYMHEAPRYARKINVHLTDFVIFPRSGGPDHSILDSFPEPAAGVERSWTVLVFMTNLWDRHRLDLRHFIDHSNVLNTKYNVEIAWDPKTFDVAFLRENMQKLRFCHARSSSVDQKWPEVERAFEAAFERYAPVRSNTSRRKRKRKSNSGGESENGRKGKQQRA